MAEREVVISNTRIQYKFTEEEFLRLLGITEPGMMLAYVSTMSPDMRTVTVRLMPCP